MSKTTRKDFYKPGTLAEKGTKITLKTQPYINGVIFNPEDPITSFHTYLCVIKNIVENYEMLRTIGGVETALPEFTNIGNVEIGYAKLLLDYLSQSPIEITLKEQIVDNDILAQLEYQHENS